ncbi:MAG: phosphatase PAP2 family protein [Candidatus Nanopusillus sp.]
MSKDSIFFNKMFMIDYKISEFFYKKLMSRLAIVYIIDAISHLINLSFIFYIVFFINFSYIFLFAISTAITYLLKLIVNRKRPYYYFDKRFAILVYENHSFPSEHTIIAILSFIITGNVLVLITPILRIITLKHWLSDALFSIILSIILYIFFGSIFNFSGLFNQLIRFLI